MAKKNKEQKLNLFYLEDEEKKKSKSKKRKYVKNNRKKQDTDTNNNETFCFDDEIIIGVTRIPEEKPIKQNSKNKKSKKKNNKKSKKQLDNKNTKQKNNSKKVNKNKKQYKKKTLSNEQIKKRKRIIRIVKYSTLSLCILTAVICTMFSPLFNIENITVTGNEKIGTNEIISLSQIQKGENTYKINKSKTIQNIKQNAYIENVTIKRKLPSEVEIIVQERKTSFILEYASSFVYINNQGYVLEVSGEKLNLPIIQGQETQDDKYVAGNRICESDLEKLSTVIKIMEVAEVNEISDLITRIDISNSQNYKIVFESEGKIAYLGDNLDLNTKILHIKKILEKEKGIEGEIFVNIDLNTGYPTFRQKV